MTTRTGTLSRSQSTREEKRRYVLAGCTRPFFSRWMCARAALRPPSPHLSSPKRRGKSDERMEDGRDNGRTREIIGWRHMRDEKKEKREHLGYVRTAAMQPSKNTHRHTHTHADNEDEEAEAPTKKYMHIMSANAAVSGRPSRKAAHHRAPTRHAINELERPTSGARSALQRSAR